MAATLAQLEETLKEQYFVGYNIVVGGAAVIDLINTASANRDLKKIRESRGV